MEEDNNDGLKGFQLTRQVLISVYVSMLTASAGAHTTIAAVLVPQLSAESGDIQPPLSLSQSTWFASMHSLSAMVGSVSGGVLIHWLGPRRVLLLQAVPTVLGWLVMGTATNFTMLIVARILVGMACGVCLSASQVYLGETASPQIRGRLVCVSGVMNATGCMLSYIGGYALHWRWVCALPALLCVLPGWLGVLFAVPESPYWLLNKNRLSDARESLRITRNGDQHLADSQLAIILERQQVHQKSQKPLSGRQVIAQLRHVHVLVPLLTICALFLCRVMAGIITVLVYAVEIFESMADGSESTLSSYESAIVLGAVRVFTSLASVLYVSDRFGRRTLLMLSGVVCCASNLFLAIFLTLRRTYSDWSGWPQLAWLTLLNMIVFLMVFDFGFARTGWVIHSELLPTQVRSAFSGPAICTHFFFSFITVFTFPYMRESLTLGGVFVIYAIFSFIGFLVTYFLVPETKNQSLEVIEDFYTKRFAKHNQPAPENQIESTKV